MPIMMMMRSYLILKAQKVKNRKRIATSAIQNQIKKKSTKVRMKIRRKSGILYRAPLKLLISDSPGLSTLIITIRLFGTTTSRCKDFVNNNIV